MTWRTPRLAQAAPTGSGQAEGLRALASTGRPGPREHGRAARSGARPGAGHDELVDDLDRLDALAAGVGPRIAQLLADPAVTDVLVNGVDTWVDRGDGLCRVSLELGDEDEVRALAVRMAAACGRRLDDAAPVVDGTLPAGVRLHAVLPPVSASGTLVSLRTSARKPLGLEDLVERDTVHPLLARVLAALVRGRANLLVSGATGAGKTTLLSALLALVPPDQRIICIEEASELHPRHPHVVSLQERRPNVQGAGGVCLSDLVRAAMRMRPDRLVLGECRGAEVRDVLTALNTGHEGGMATVHANTVEAVPARLLALGALAGMDEGALAAQAVAALDAIVQIRRFSGDAASSGEGTRRRVSQVGVLIRRGAHLECVPALQIDHDMVMRPGPGFECFLARSQGWLAGILDPADAPWEGKRRRGVAGEGR
ncbi:TadA family conjugal transfer-associated ATPase [Schaalia sp. 19OD2882]|uniref:TadA family conjugal transfer-associated ATPase n=1 Tax=Schaalia sp. 19OD2882 TaxID=2794089 RepID=UPI001C1EF184|nr:TadA family conjugal transfer-associated ATPase [Schaalia sp. 19OD2882]QWW19720.1 TadA family conjugal transfer-associated ATPase [Schaalia sp. 19OD2882]